MNIIKIGEIRINLGNGRIKNSTVIVILTALSFTPMK